MNDERTPAVYARIGQRLLVLVDVDWYIYGCGARFCEKACFDVASWAQQCSVVFSSIANCNVRRRHTAAYNTTLGTAGTDIQRGHLLTSIVVRSVPFLGGYLGSLGSHNERQNNWWW